MPQSCAVPFCSEKKGGYQFPRDEKLLKQWLIAIRRKKFTPSKHARVCKKHFNPDDLALPKESYSENPCLRLKPMAVPSRFSWNEESEEKKEIKRKRAERALQREQKRETATNINKETVGSKEENQCVYIPCIEHFLSVTLEETSQEMDIEGTNKDAFLYNSLDANVKRD